MPTLRAALFAICLPSLAWAETYLLMAEERGCYWCQKWTEEIGHIYPKTAEGRAAPLRRYNLHFDDPGVSFAHRVSYTPTFILVQDGVEVGRIEGHPGEDFFWPMLSMLLKRAAIPLDPAG